jgi:hypothetical protein
MHGRGVSLIAAGQRLRLTIGTPHANFVPMNMADDWLHLVLAVGMIALGVLLGRDRRALG